MGSGCANLEADICWSTIRCLTWLEIELGKGRLLSFFENMVKDDYLESGPAAINKHPSSCFRENPSRRRSPVGRAAAPQEERDRVQNGRKRLHRTSCLAFACSPCSFHRCRVHSRREETRHAHGIRSTFPGDGRAEKRASHPVIWQ
jgi:hypothetical protein